MNYKRELEILGLETYDVAGVNDVLINCPFHEDKKPSCEVHVKKGVFYCFGCGVSGSWYKLVSEITGEDYSEVKDRHLTVECQNSISTLKRFAKGKIGMEKQEDIPRAFSINSFHRKYSPVQNTDGMRYLRRRGISNKTATKFDLRWGGSEGVMRERVVFPIYSEEGRLISFGGRAIRGKQQPKTRKVQTARNELFGLFQLIRLEIFEKSYIVLVEGEFDAMYLQQLGFPTVASMGTAKLTERKITLLKKYAKKVYVAYDGDAKGRESQEKAIDCLNPYLPVIGLRIPNGLDPDDLTKSQFARLLKGR